MLRRVIVIMHMLKPLGPCLARHLLWLSAEKERIVIEGNLGRVDLIDQRLDRPFVEGKHLWTIKD